MFSSISRFFTLLFSALLYKNYLIKRRSICSTISEILLPILIIIFLVLFRSLVSIEWNDPSLHTSDTFTYTNNLQAKQYAVNSLIQSTKYTGDLAFIVNSRYGDAGHQRIDINDLLASWYTYNQGVTFTIPTNRLTDLRNSSSIPYTLYNTTRTDFLNEQQLINYVSSDQYSIKYGNPPIISAILLDYNPDTQQYVYKIRGNITSTPKTTLSSELPVVNTLQWIYDSTTYNAITGSGILYLSNFVENYILQLYTRSSSPTSPFSNPYNITSYQSNLQYQPMPTPRYMADVFSSRIGDFIGILVTLCFIWTVTRQTKSLTEEKENRIREGMAIMGLKHVYIWLSWWLTYCILFIVMCILMTVISSSKLFRFSNPALIFIWFFFFSLATFSFSYFISSMFHRSRTAATVAAVLFLISYFPYYVVGSSKSIGENTLACLCIPTAFGLLANNVFTLESIGLGIQPDRTTLVVNNFYFSLGIGMLILDIIIYLLAGLYIEAITPSEYGTHKPWYFLCQCGVWKRNKQRSELQRKVSTELELMDNANNPYIEQVNEQNRTVALQSTHLRKEFKGRNGDKFGAVKDLNMRLYDGEIVVLLGHNGAGKSTTINMLCGMISATSGDAVMYGNSINGDMNQIRTILGICPQHDVLFDLLTVREHLELYAHIKGIPRKEIPDAVRRTIQTVGLTEKADALSRTLSGGQKRKLSVGIALLGDSKIVFLDEPTSGMDPYSRRSTWDLLQQNKQGKLIILTTHFMDEADYLGDRIAIMSEGKVQCFGSSLFLKNKYGIGYILTIVKHMNCDVSAIRRLVEGSVEGAQLLNHSAGEISFRLPQSSSSSFPALLRQFDIDKERLGIINYGISVTTLEEVFLKVAEQSHNNGNGNGKLLNDAHTQVEIGSLEKTKPDPFSIIVNLNGNQDDSATTTVQVRPRSDPHHKVDVPHKDMNSLLSVPKYDTKQVSRWWIHLKALLIKRYIDSKRNKRAVLWTIFIPFVILLVGLAVVKSNSSSSYSSLSLNQGVLQQYNQPLNVPYYVNTTNINLKLVSSTAPYHLNYTFQPQCVDSQSCAAWLYQDWTTQRLSKYGAFTSQWSYANNTLNDATTIYFNTSSPYSLLAYHTLYNDLLLKSLSNNLSLSIAMELQPLPATKDQSTIINSLSAIFVALAFAFIPAHFIYYSVNETHSKTRHQQFISGIHPLIYHISNTIWDFINYLVPGILLLILLAIFGIDQLIGDNSGATILAIILFGLSVISFSYMCSFFFTNPTTAQNTMLIVFILLGEVLLIVSLVLDQLASDVNKTLKYFYRIFPSYCFSESIANIVQRKSLASYGQVMPLYDMDITGKPFIYMTVEIFVFFAIVMLIEYIQSTPELFKRIDMFVGLFYRSSRKKEEENMDEMDIDVKNERKRVEEQFLLSADKQDMVLIKDLSKVYRGNPPKHALKSLSLGIGEGECLGYLGINGAGKTTTMKILTNDLYPSTGRVLFNGIDIMMHQDVVRHLIGYCPQFDTIIPNLSGREHLQLFARIKMIREEYIDDLVNEMIVLLGLQDGIADRLASTYSGGNKRRLCVGMALIGNPKVLFLDEPSTGVDPVNRRHMWDLIESTMKGRSVILTTHSMEECEALCDRIGIMVSGQLQCLGSSQHLKHRFGDGFQMDLNIDAEKRVECLEWIQATFPSSRVIESNYNNAKVKIDKQQRNRGNGNDVTLSISSIFESIELNKSRLSIKEYSVSEVSLEQIFIHFAAKQKEELGVATAFTSQ